MARKKSTPAKSVSRVEQRERTRSKLIAIARDEFSKRGFAGVSTERLVTRARLTRGALYHQFEDKRAVFQAAFQAAQQDIVDAIGRAVEKAPDEWAALRDGCRAFLEAASRPDVRTIVLIDGPAVLGWSEWRRMDAENGIKELRAGITALMDGGIIERGSPDALTYMLSGAMNDGAMWVAEAPDREKALKEAMGVMDTLLEGLRRD